MINKEEAEMPISVGNSTVLAWHQVHLLSRAHFLSFESTKVVEPCIMVTLLGGTQQGELGLLPDPLNKPSNI